MIKFSKGINYPFYKMDGSIKFTDIDDFISTSKLLKTHGKNIKFLYKMSNKNIEQLLTTTKENLQYVLDNNVGKSMFRTILNTILYSFYPVRGKYYRKVENINFENVEIILQKFITEKREYATESWIVKNILELYHDTKSPIVRDFIVYIIKNEYIDGQALILYYRDGDNPWDEFKDIISQLNQSEFNKFVSQYTGTTTQLQKLYKEAIAGKVVDTAMGLRNSGLPSIAVENIASHAYDTTGFNLYQLMSMVRPVTEGGRPGVMGAGQTEYDEQEYIDV